VVWWLPIADPLKLLARLELDTSGLAGEFLHAAMIRRQTQILHATVRLYLDRLSDRWICGDAEVETIRVLRMDGDKVM
jgi:hypothetical protein